MRSQAYPIPLTAVLIFLQAICLSQAAKLYLCGDSTMARGNGKIDGWGEHLAPLVTIPVVNRAIGGRSARSFTVEGRFDAVAKLVAPGDYVVIEFGHNDGGALNPAKDSGRTPCPGTGNQICESEFQGQKVSVRTFPAYFTAAGKMFVAKGARVVFSSMTPNNIWEDGKGAYTPNRFSDYARQSAKEVGANASFVDHGLWTAKAYQQLGKKRVDALYPQDHTHTSPEGAKVVAEAFVTAVLEARDSLKIFVKGKAKR
jgi:rhamnogalacturonan acetylesterase